LLSASCSSRKTKHSEGSNVFVVTSLPSKWIKVAHVNKGPKTRNSDSCSKETCPGAFFIIFQYMFIEFKWESFPGNWRLATERYQSQAQSIKMLCSVHLALDDHDPYAKGFAPLPLEFSRLKQENMGAPSAGGIAHCSQKHKRVLTAEHNLPPSIGVASLVPPLMHNSFTWTANNGRPLAEGAEKPIPKQKM